MINLYSLLTFFVSVVISPFFLLSARGRRRFLERFGAWDLPSGDYIWLHVASVGEAKGICPLIHELRRLSEQKILVTATSPTGLDQVLEVADEVRLVPFDSQLWYRLALKGAAIKLFVQSEVEIWPGLNAELARRSIPSYLVNCRFSEKTARYLGWLKRLSLYDLGVFRVSFVVSSRIKQLLLGLGVPDDKIIVAGNTKYDLSPSVKTPEEALVLKQKFFGDRAKPVLVLGSLHPGEEKPWFQALEAVSAWNYFDILLAPRHLERTSYFERALTSAGKAYACWSLLETGLGGAAQEAVLLLDTLGSLEKTYSFATLVFIGGSLVNLGGHNPLEACLYGRPVVMGPFHANVENVIDELKAKDAIRIVNHKDDIVKVIGESQNSSPSLADMGARGLEVSKVMTGASSRVAKLLMEEV